MILRISSKRQVTLPVQLLDAMGVKPGDRIEVVEGPEGFVIKPRRIDYSRLGTLRDKIKRGRGTFDIQSFREQRFATDIR